MIQSVGLLIPSASPVVPSQRHLVWWGHGALLPWTVQFRISLLSHVQWQLIDPSYMSRELDQARVLMIDAPSRSRPVLIHANRFLGLCAISVDGKTSKAGRR